MNTLDTDSETFATLFEVGPRDGLQSLKQPIPTAQKIDLINALSKTGLRKIEATSFVNANWVPQLADGPAVMAAIERASTVAYAGLTPNLRGVRSAVQSRCDEIAVFISASEGFSRANINCSVKDSLEAVAEALAFAACHAIPARGYISCVTDCPFDGPTPPATVARLAERLIALGCYQISLGDTLGSATPEKIEAVLRALAPVVPVVRLAGHFHDTHGLALDSIDCALDFGIRTFDASVAGLGGCPYAPGASGNVNTRTVVEHLHNRGFETGIDLDALKEAEQIAMKMTDAA
ncbi:MAG: hydroxymethylglutaryl-CoA lyase [Pseudomonadota bacterium]